MVERSSDIFFERHDSRVESFTFESATQIAARRRCTCARSLRAWLAMLLRRRDAPPPSASTVPRRGLREQCNPPHRRRASSGFSMPNAWLCLVLHPPPIRRRIGVLAIDHAAFVGSCDGLGSTTPDFAHARAHGGRGMPRTGSRGVSTSNAGSTVRCGVAPMCAPTPPAQTRDRHELD